MPHQSEISESLNISCVPVSNISDLSPHVSKFNDVCILVLPQSQGDAFLQLSNVSEIINRISANLGPESTLITIGEISDLVHMHSYLKEVAHFQHWISIKKANPTCCLEGRYLPRYHFGALVHTFYEGPLRHSITRIKYTYCPACEKTTKDYGGKKSTHHHYGTLISDVWRDINCDLKGDLTLIFQRFADLFSVDPYQELRVLDLRSIILEQTEETREQQEVTHQTFSWNSIEPLDNLLPGDCLENLRYIPDNSVDFIFVDPPYNLGKKYDNYSDDLAITEYFQWCDKWLGELARILRPGRTLSLLNVPIHAIRHYLYLESVLEFQNWITWDALSFPVRKIMPANYTILCFSKGKARKLPGLIEQNGNFCSIESTKTYESLRPLAEDYCRRSECVSARKSQRIIDRGPLTDLWWDIHRLRHNSRRVNHPTQLPPQLLYRLISIFTKPGEIVLDCFNGSGTTTLTTKQLGRKYIGIEASANYYRLAQERHREVLQHLDPFRTETRNLTVKNNSAQRLGKIKYEVPKKELQLEVKRIAEKLNHIPTRDEIAEHSKYPVKYFDDYFSSWGEVYAAARTTGMIETRPGGEEKNQKHDKVIQPRLFDMDSSNE